MCVCFSRIRLPAVPGGELGAGSDRSLHGGGREALPVCLQPHHQGQTRESIRSSHHAVILFVSSEETVDLMSNLTLTPGANSTLEPERQ